MLNPDTCRGWGRVKREGAAGWRGREEGRERGGGKGNEKDGRTSLAGSKN